MRSWFRHEQQSIRMALAAVLHHSYDRVHTEYVAPRSQNTATLARGGGGSYDMKFSAKFRKTPPLQAFFQLYDEEDAEREDRPAALLEPRPQGSVQWHIALHIVDILPYVQILDVPVPQMGGQLVEFMQHLDTSILDEQVIAVPKIFLDRIPQRSALRRTQKAEQLVEVPTDSAYALGALISSALGGGLQGSLPEQDSLRLQRAVEQILDTPVPGCGGGGARGGLQGSRARQNSTAADVEQIVDIPARRGLPDFIPGQSSTASSSSRLLDDADEGIQGFFRTFSTVVKSAKLGPHSGSELSADFTASYEVSDAVPMWDDEDGNTWWRSSSGQWYLLGSDRTVWWDAPG